MLIKQPDDKTNDIACLKGLAARPDVSAEVRKNIEQEIRFMQSGMKGEAEAAYEMEFHFGASKNWMLIHDLRIECEGRVAQIDHLILNRFMEIYVCESKRFSEGVAINEHGEFSAFYGSKPYGVPSPLEQNKRHILVLESVFKSGLVAPPKRLGFNITPSLLGLVLVSKGARISRPKEKLDALDCVIKNDQLKSRIERDRDADSNPLNAARIIGQDTLEDFARRLAAIHKPLTFDWAAKFGISSSYPAASAKTATVVKVEEPAAAVEAEGEKKSKLV
ncbi:MAG: nuclease-related domain-containing protein, partial [Sideroxydans sp.]